MTILVTGGLGYLGSRLLGSIVDHPSFSDEEIRIVDNFRRPCHHTLWHLPTNGRFTLEPIDIREAEELRSVLDGVDVVFHLAAVTNASASFDIPEKTREINYEAALAAGKAARDAGISRFVNISTCSVYGSGDVEYTETSPTDPASPYARAKLKAERDLQALDGLPTVSVRLGTVYGWSAGMRFDTVVNKFSFHAACGEPLTVYEGAAGQQRPYLHVNDAVKALLAAATDLQAGETYNVVGENARLSHVVSLIDEIFEDVTVKYVEHERLNQVSYQVNGQKIREAGFAPERGIRDGIDGLADKLTPIMQ